LVGEGRAGTPGFLSLTLEKKIGRELREKARIFF